MKNRIKLLLGTVLALSMSTLSFAEEEKCYSFDIISKVYDYHDSAIAVVINLDREIFTDSLATRTFGVKAKTTDNQHEDSTIYYEGLRTITDIYTNSTGIVGEREESGNHIVIELFHGANVEEAILCPYMEETYAQSAFLTPEYEIIQYADAGAQLPVNEGVEFVQGELKTETVDEFAYGGDDKVGYRLYTPEMVEGEKYPLVIWLHGFGERGTDKETILRSNRGAVAWAEERVQKEYPSFVMAAQASSEKAWSDDSMINTLLDNIKEVIAENPMIDSERVYITGVSSGGGGTWRTLLADPDLFAAAMPLAPAYTVVDEEGVMTEEAKAELKKLVEKPIYIIHGDGDPVVDIEKTSNPIYQYLTEEVKNPNVYFTKIKDASYAERDHYTLHNVEVRVFNFDVVFNTSYSDENLAGDISLPADKNDSNLTPIDWMFAQSK